MPQCWRAWAKRSGSSLLNLVIFDTCLGWMGVAVSPKGLRQVIPPHKSKKEALAQVIGDYSLVEEADAALLGDLPQRLGRYLTGAVVDFPDRLDLEGATTFQQGVWRVAQTIPYGETRNYGWISDQLGYGKKAARAVGQALGRNPLLIIIPCHRVISEGGGLGGFSAGLELKKYLLRLESAR